MLRQLSQTVVPPPGRRADLSPRTYINRIFDLKIEDDDIEPWSYSPRMPLSSDESCLRKALGHLRIFVNRHPLCACRVQSVRFTGTCFWVRHF